MHPERLGEARSEVGLRNLQYSHAQFRGPVIGAQANAESVLSVLVGTLSEEPQYINSRPTPTPDKADKAGKVGGDGARDFPLHLMFSRGATSLPPGTTLQHHLRLLTEKQDGLTRPTAGFRLNRSEQDDASLSTSVGAMNQQAQYMN
jgi:hypothetical protein